MAHWEKQGMSDVWYTPSYIFKALEVEFDLDVASPDDKALTDVPAKKFIEKNSLECQWDGFVWMNPPFGGRNAIDKWIKKLIQHGDGIALTPDRTSTAWWQNAADRADCILFIKGKVKFISGSGKPNNSPSTGTTLFGYGKNAVSALTSAAKNELGFLVIK